MNVHPDRAALEASLRAFYGLTVNFPAYAKQFLKIKNKEGGSHSPFALRPAQLHLHKCLEAERKERGFVRALIPKARQMGVSTFVEGMAFHRTSYFEGVRAFIVAHQLDSTATLFEMAKNFYEKLDDNDMPFSVRPTLGRSNRKELLFPGLDSGYLVATAQGDEIGRSTNNQFLHLSEVAFFQNEKEIATGLMNTVAMGAGEILFESTGNGPRGMFYRLCREAIQSSNKGLWRCYFLPWTLDPGYRTAVPSGFVLPPEFKEYQGLHSLDDEQMQYYYNKNLETAVMYGQGTDKICWATRQEYPIHVDECFQASDEAAFFPGQDILRAQMTIPAPTAGAPHMLGVDVGGDGGDPTHLMDRKGLALGSLVNFELRSGSPEAQGDIIFNLTMQHGINVVVVDNTGIGWGLVGILRLKFGGTKVRVVAIDFGGKANNPNEYLNRRSEMHDRLRLFLRGEDDMQASIPKDDAFAGEMGAYRWGQSEVRRNDKHLLQLTHKEKIKKDYLEGHSPNRTDAAILTLALDDHIVRRALTEGSYHRG